MSNLYYDVVIVGGGAAGMMAAISASEHQSKIAIIEHLDLLGKKILVTGNGRCNFTNLEQGISHYYGENPAFVVPVFQQFDVKKTIDFFSNIGIWPKSRNGYIYPQSDQAASVRELLVAELKQRSNLDIFTGRQITTIKKQKHGFYIQTNGEEFFSHALILATGLYAGKSCGCDGSIIPYIENFGHTIIDVVPALVQLKTNLAFFKQLAGIRAEICLKLLVNDTLTGTEEGELQLTVDGISGIVVFQLSRIATSALKQNKEVKAIIDFKPKLTLEEFNLKLASLQEHNKEKRFATCLEGILPKKLIPILLDQLSIRKETPMKNLSSKQMKQFCFLVKDFSVPIVSSNSFSDCQVCAGGVSTDEIDAETLMSKIIPNLFFAGELIDIDGKCGGYNLQWAWSSGYVAGYYGGQTK